MNSVTNLRCPSNDPQIYKNIENTGKTRNTKIISLIQNAVSVLIPNSASIKLWTYKVENPVNANMQKIITTWILFVTPQRCFNLFQRFICDLRLALII